jgi:membrane-associated phospholipid phosphatase
MAKKLILFYFLFFLAIYFFIIPLKAYSDNYSASSGNTGGIPAKLFGIGIADVKSYPSFLVSEKNYIAGFSLILGAGFLADRGINDYMLSHRNATETAVSNLAYPFGKPYYTAPAAALLSLYGYYSNNTKLLNASFTSLESGLTAGIIAEALKITAGRERPSGTNGPFNFQLFSIDDKYNSFPSGDAVIAWSMITPYAVYYKQPLLYLIPAAVDMERVYKNKHWVSDTLMGTAIGFSIGYLFSNNHITKNIYFVSTGGNLLLNVKF